MFKNNQIIKMSDHKLQPVRGAKDLFGDEILQFNHITQTARQISENYGFCELQTPIFEFSEIFERNLGETSDIISKEVYKFQDRGDNFLTLRPEFTAAIVRAFLSNGVLQQTLPQKFFSCGPIFRYDRPQKGRQRQFHQINFEIFGQNYFLQDVEVIALAAEILKAFGLENEVELHINSLGCADSKANYEAALREYFLKFENELSADSKTRLQKNPLRILDSKDAKDIELCKNAPPISDFYQGEAKENFAKILAQLQKQKIVFTHNPRLVRGLDYYTSTVFEFIMKDASGAQNTVLAGGRYDDLVEKMGGKNTPAIGFAAGIERLMLLAKFSPIKNQKLSVIYIDQAQENHAFELAQSLRKQGFAVDFSFDSSFKKQMKKATQNESNFVLIIGEDEMKNGEVVVKNFSDSTQNKVAISEIANFLENAVK